MEPRKRDVGKKKNRKKIFLISFKEIEESFVTMIVYRSSNFILISLLSANRRKTPVVAYSLYLHIYLLYVVKA